MSKIIPQDRSIRLGLLFIASIFLPVLLLWIILPSGSEKVAQAANFSSITVCPGGVGCDYPSLKEAISFAVSGDTILIAPGTYTETGQIILDKSLTIQASGAEKPVIKPSRHTDSGAGDKRGWWIISPGVAVTLTQVILDGSGKHIMEALRVHGSLAANENEFLNLSYSLLTSPADPYHDIQGVAIYLEQGGTAVIMDNQFSAIGRVGVLACGGDSDSTAQTNLTFGDNTYTGKGPTGPLDFAVWVGGKVNAQIVENSVSGNVGQVGGLSSSAIQVQAGTVCPRTGTPQVEVMFNRFVDNLFGMQNTTSAQVKAENNWWGCSAGPGQVGCDPVSENLDYDPWIVSKLAVASGRVPNGGITTVTSSLTYNSAMSDTAPLGYFVPATASFSATLGTVQPQSVVFGSGLAQSMFTAGSVDGLARISAQVDYQLVWTHLVVDKVSIFLPVVFGKPSMEIFLDDFEDSNPVWMVESTDPPAIVEYVSGWYQISLNNTLKRTTAVAPVVVPGGDYSVEVDTHRVSGESTTFGIIFNRKELESYYIFLLKPTTYDFSVYKRAYPGSWEWITGGKDNDIFSIANKMKMECSGDEFTLYINDKEVGVFTDATYDSSDVQVGFQVWSYDIPATVQFDNFMVMRLP